MKEDSGTIFSIGFLTFLLGMLIGMLSIIAVESLNENEEGDMVKQKELKAYPYHVYKYEPDEQTVCYIIDNDGIDCMIKE